MWRAKEISLLNYHECRAYVKIYSPSPTMVTSPYGWKILEWDEKSQNKPKTQNKTKQYSPGPLGYTYCFQNSTVKWIYDNTEHGYWRAPPLQDEEAWIHGKRTILYNTKRLIAFEDESAKIKLLITETCKIVEKFILQVPKQRCRKSRGPPQGSWNCWLRMLEAWWGNGRRRRRTLTYPNLFKEGDPDPQWTFQN